MLCTILLIAYITISQQKLLIRVIQVQCMKTLGVGRSENMAKMANQSMTLTGTMIMDKAYHMLITGKTVSEVQAYQFLPYRGEESRSVPRGTKCSVKQTLGEAFLTWLFESF
jgi:hypothetical protein